MGNPKGTEWTHMRRLFGALFCCFSSACRCNQSTIWPLFLQSRSEGIENNERAATAMDESEPDAGKTKEKAKDEEETARQTVRIVHWAGYEVFDEHKYEDIATR